MTDTLQSGTGGDLKDTAQQKAQEVAGQAKEKAMDAAAPAAQNLKSQLDSRTTAAGEGIAGLADVARLAGDDMREKGQDGPAKYADQAADYVDRVGGYLKSADPDRMLHDAESLARRMPGLVASGGLVLGFLAARFLRASSQGRSGVDQSYRGEYTPASELSSGYAAADRSFRERSAEVSSPTPTNPATGLPSTLDAVRPASATGGGYAADVDLGTTGVRPGDIGLPDGLADPDGRR